MASSQPYLRTADDGTYELSFRQKRAVFIFFLIASTLRKTP